MSIIKRARKKGFSLLVKASPKIASKVIFYKKFGKQLDLKNPTTFNEKLMWLKLNEDESKKIICTDKYLVREFIEDLGYSAILNELYKVYDSVEEIDFEELPNKFVMKCTHGSGFNIICSDKDILNTEETLKQLSKWMKTDYSLVCSEPHYAKIKPRIVVERFLEGSDGKVPIDYKFHCFHGEPKIVEVIIDRWTPGMKDIFFDFDWNIIPYYQSCIDLHQPVQKPEKFDEMLEIARKLSSTFTFVRVDLYYSNNEIYFGELTFTPSGCLDRNFINNADYELGKFLDLSKAKVN